MKNLKQCNKAEPCLETTTHIIENTDEAGLDHSLCQNCGRDIIMIGENQWIHK